MQLGVRFIRILQNSEGHEGIFLGYSSRTKTYKCLNKVIDTMVESENVIIDEFVDKNDEKRKKEPEDSNIFMYVQEGTPGTLLE